MDEGQLQRIIREPFCMAPRRLLENNKLAFSTRVVGSWLLGLPPHWKMRVKQVKHKFNLGQDAWKTVRDELSEIGVLDCNKKQLPNGQWTWEYKIYDLPPLPDV